MTSPSGIVATTLVTADRDASKESYLAAYGLPVFFEGADSVLNQVRHYRSVAGVFTGSLGRATLARGSPPRGVRDQKGVARVVRLHGHHRGFAAGAIRG